MPRMSLAKLSTVALKKELQRRLEALPKLIAQRDELNRQIAELEAVAGVLATGYTSTSKDFPDLVKKTLANDKRFERVARGVYRVKG